MRPGLAILALLAAVAPGCGESDPAAPAPPRVRTARAEAPAAPPEELFPAVARTSAETRLAFKIAGRVARVEARRGERIQAGALVATLDPAAAEGELRRAEAQLSEAAAAERRAQSDRDIARSRPLGAPGPSLVEANRALRSARERMREAGQEIDLARLRLAATELRAPFAGRVVSVTASAGQELRAGEPIALLEAPPRLDLELALPESWIGSVEEGSPASARFDALPGRVLGARVVEVGAAADVGEPELPVRLRLDEEHPELHPGMRAQVGFPRAAPGAVVVPVVAVGEDASGRYVLRVDPAGAERGRLRRVAVTTGGLSGAGLEVLEGLEPGQRVVAEPPEGFQDGAEVRIEPADPS